MRRNTLLAGLLTTALLAASAPADAAVFLKLPGVEGEVHDDDHAKWIEVLSYGDVEEDELTATAFEAQLAGSLVVDPEAAGNGGNPVQLYSPNSAHVSADSFFDVFVEANVDSTGGRSGDSFFDIFIEDDLRTGSPAHDAGVLPDDYEAATPLGSVTVRDADETRGS